MKKGLAIILAAVVLLCALTGGLVYTWKQRGRPFTAIGYRFYPFPRLTCTAEITVDGKQVPLTADMVTAGEMDSHAENTVQSVEQTESGGIIKCKGGEYGSQPFFITLQKADGTPVRFQIRTIVANNWEISDISLTLSVDSASNSYKVRYRYVMYQDEQGGGAETTLHEENTVTISSI